MLPALAEATQQPEIKSMPGVDVHNEFARTIAHGKNTGGAGSMGALAWLSSEQNKSSLKSLGKWNRKTAIEWGDQDNTAQLPQSMRAQPTGM